MYSVCTSTGKLVEVFVRRNNGVPYVCPICLASNKRKIDLETEVVLCVFLLHYIDIV